MTIKMSALSCAFMSMSFTNAFISLPTTINVFRSQEAFLQINKTPLHMDPSSVSEIVQSAVENHLLFKNFQILSQQVPTVLMPDPQVESELFKDISHVLMDFFVFLNPDTYLLRLAIVMGQIFGWASSLVIDKAINPNDLFFQLITFPISVILLTRSLWPILKALRVELSQLDLAAYQQLFEPVGVSLLQFRALKATEALDWVTVDAGTVLVDENDSLEEGSSPNSLSYSSSSSSFEGCSHCLYWLYKGDVRVSYNGQMVTYLERSNGRFIDDPNSSGLLADMRFLYQMEERSHGKLSKIQRDFLNDVVDFFQNPRQKSSGTSNKPGVLNATYPMLTMVVGNQGGTLLRMDSVKLLDLMEHDGNLSNSMRRLLLKSLQRKIGHLLDAQTRTAKGACDWSTLD